MVFGVSTTANYSEGMFVGSKGADGKFRLQDLSSSRLTMADLKALHDFIGKIIDTEEGVR